MIAAVRAGLASGGRQLGLDRLLAGDDRILGCVRTHFLTAPRTTELTYVLHPELWGRGIATAMGWTAMQQAFGSGCVDAVIAATDDPNTASVAVMRRLGMRFLGHTRNPRWSGVEYVRHRSDPWPDPVPRSLVMGT